MGKNCKKDRKREKPSGPYFLTSLWNRPATPRRLPADDIQSRNGQKDHFWIERGKSGGKRKKGQPGKTIDFLQVLSAPSSLAPREARSAQFKHSFTRLAAK